VTGCRKYKACPSELENVQNWSVRCLQGKVRNFLQPRHTQSLSHSISPLRTALFFGEGTISPPRPQLTRGLLTKDRDPLYLFNARNGTHSSVGTPSTAHLYRKDLAQTLRFQAFRHTGRAARGHSTVSRICPMFTYLVHSIALFCTALQCHWPEVDDLKEYIVKNQNSFLQRSRNRRRLLQNSLLQNRNLGHAFCDLIPRDPAANRLARQRASSAANERPCTELPT